jgi:hypothetical protein
MLKALNHSNAGLTNYTLLKHEKAYSFFPHTRIVLYNHRPWDGANSTYINTYKIPRKNYFQTQNAQGGNLLKLENRIPVDEIFPFL